MTAVSSSDVILPSYDSTLGAVLIGGFVSVFLYGVTCLQMFIYYQRYPSDRRFIKITVAALWFIDSLDAALTCQICYYYLVTNYANPSAIFFPVWSLKLHVFVTMLENAFQSLSDFVVRSLFARRVYTLSRKNKFITVVIAALSVVDLVVGTIITIKAFHIQTFAGLLVLADLFYLNFASNISADLCVALDGFAKSLILRTDSLVVKLIIYTVNTGLLTVFDASAGLICYAAMPTTLVFIAFYLNLSKFYVNSYLASLNVRKTLLTSMKSDHVLASIRLSGGASHNMPNFRTVTASGMSGHDNSTNVRHTRPSHFGYPGTQQGDGSTVVNTPTDVPLMGLGGFDGYKSPRGLGYDDGRKIGDSEGRGNTFEPRVLEDRAHGRGYYADRGNVDEDPYEVPRDAKSLRTSIRAFYPGPFLRISQRIPEKTRLRIRAHDTIIVH
ncbi:hypothetical protein DFH11DRAFT_1547688 [Phellopilus nigrolimitatus]|nr:hypothetical protein DFH11DRAFT_1547688 [Phellopilus nigrolimitatus]